MGFESVDPKSIKIDAKDSPPPTDISMPDRGQKPGEEQDLVDRGVKPGEEQGMDRDDAKIAAWKFPTLPEDHGSKLPSTPDAGSNPGTRVRKRHAAARCSSRRRRTGAGCHFMPRERTQSHEHEIRGFERVSRG